MRLWKEIQAMPWALVVTPRCPTYIDVSAGILADEDGRVLITERLGEGPFQGMWEFPGGKIASGETAEAALIRELQEEIGIDALEFAPFMLLEHDYPDRSVRLHFFKVKKWQGEPIGIDGQKLRWIMPAEIDPGCLLPADAPVIAKLLA